MVASARPRGRSRPRDGSVGRAGSARATRSSSIALAVTALFALVAPSDGGRALKGSALDAFEVDARSAAGAADSDAASASASDASAASDGACTLVGYGVGERVRDGWYTMRDGEVRAYPRSWASRARTSASARASDSDVAYEGAERSVRARARARTCAWRTRRARGGPSTPARRAAPCSRSRATGGLPPVSTIPGGHVRHPGGGLRRRELSQGFPGGRGTRGARRRARNALGLRRRLRRRRRRRRRRRVDVARVPRGTDPRGGLRGRFTEPATPRTSRTGSPRWGRARTRRW